MLPHRVMQGASGYVSGGSSNGPFNNSNNYLFGAYNGTVTPVNIIQKYNGTSRTTETATMSQAKYGVSCAAILPSASKDFMIGGILGTLSMSNNIDAWNGTTRTLAYSTMQNNVHRSMAMYVNGNNYFQDGNARSRWTGSVYTYALITTSLTSQYAGASYFPSTDVGYNFGGPGKWSTTAIIKWTGTTESTETATMAVTQDGAACSYLTDSTAYKIGGANASGLESRIEKWDGSSRTTETATLAAALRYNHGSFIGGNIYIYGGYNGTTVINTIQKWDGTTRSSESATLSAAQGYISPAEL